MNTFIRNPNFREPKSPTIKIKMPLNTYNIIVAQQSLPPNKNQYFFPFVDVSQKFEETLEKCRKNQKKKMRINAIEKVTISKNLSDNILQNYRKIEENTKQNIAPRDRCQSESMTETNDGQKNRRASELVDQLLLDIYGRNNYGSCQIGKNFETEYGSSTSFKSAHEKYDEKLQYYSLENKDIAELHILTNALTKRITYSGHLLVKQLKKKDALKSKQDKICNVITAHLHAYSDKRSEDTNMRFSPNPIPGDSGFNQWRDAMKMVAKLPGGIPPEFRKKLWKALAEKHLQSRGVNWEQTEKLCFNEWSNPDDSELGIQIVKDLHRTGCSLFCGAAGQENQALLKRVLLAYARWNKSVGYCQGFNMLAALILQVMDKNETDSVKVMIYLIEGVLPESYFANNLRGLSVDMIVFRDLLKIRLPHLSKHLEALQNDAREGNSYEPPLTNVFTMQWFLTLFCNCLPQNTVLRVWDLIFLEGNEILLRTAIAIWEKLSDRILAVNSADEFYSIMGVLTREMLEFGLVDSNTLVKSIVAIGTCNELNDMRDKYLYNITPWTQSVQTAARKGFKLFYSDDDDTESDFDEKAAVTAAYGISIGRKRGSVSHLTKSLNTKDGTIIQPYAHGHPDRERLALDISALKKQYAKLRERQRQAHIILQAACARQPIGSSSSPAPIAMNHLLLGKNAIVNSRGRRLGPPKGSIPPARAPRIKEVVKKKNSAPETIHWKDTEKFRRRQSYAEESESSETYVPDSDSSSYSEDDASSTSTELCDEPGRLSDFDSEDKIEIDSKPPSDLLLPSVDLKAREIQSDIQELISETVSDLLDLNSEPETSDKPDIFDSFLAERIKNSKEVLSPKEEKEDRLKRHKSYEETASNYPEKSILCKQKSFDINNLPVIETSLWTPYQIKEESPEEPSKTSSIDLLQVEDKRLESGRRNSERALKIIQENSLILHRILQQQKSSEIEDSEDEISKTFMRSESLLSKDERTDEERSSKDGDEETESGVESFSLSPALLEEESDKSLKKDLEDEEVLTILRNSPKKNYYSVSPEDVSSSTSNKFAEEAIEDANKYKFREESEENITKHQFDIEETCINPEEIPTKFSYKFKEESEENITKSQFDNEETNRDKQYELTYKYNEESPNKTHSNKEEMFPNEDTDKLEQTSTDKYKFTYKYKEDSDENLPSTQLEKIETSPNEDNVNLEENKIEDYKFSYKYKPDSEESLPRTQIKNEEMTAVNLEETNVEKYKFSYKYKEDSEENVTRTQLEKEEMCLNIETNIEEKRLEETPIEEYKFSYKYKEESEENLAKPQLEKEEICQNKDSTLPESINKEEYKFSYKYKEESEENLTKTQLETKDNCQKAIETKPVETPIEEYKFSYKYREESEDTIPNLQLANEETSQNTCTEETDKTDYKFSYKFKENSEENVTQFQLSHDNNTDEYKFTYKYKEESEDNLTIPNLKKEENITGDDTYLLSFLGEATSNISSGSPKKKEDQNAELLSFLGEPITDFSSGPKDTKIEDMISFLSETETNASSRSSTSPRLSSEQKDTRNEEFISFFSEANILQNQEDVINKSSKEDPTQRSSILSSDAENEEFISFFSEESINRLKAQEEIRHRISIENKKRRSSIGSSSFEPSSDQIDTKDEEFTSFISAANINKLKNQEDIISRSSSKDQKSPIRCSSFKSSSNQIDTKDEKFTSFISAANINKLKNPEDMSRSSIVDQKSPIKSSSFKSSSDQIDTKDEEFTSFISAANINKLINQEDKGRSTIGDQKSPIRSSSFKQSSDQIDTKDEEFTSFISSANITQEDISRSSIKDQKSLIRSSSFKPSSDHIDTKDEEFTSFVSASNINKLKNQEDILSRSSIEDQKSPIRSSRFEPSSDQIDTKDEEFTSFFSAANINKLINQEDMNRSSIVDQKSPIRSSNIKSSSDQIDTKDEEFTSFISAANINKLKNQEDIISRSSIEDQMSPIRSSSFNPSSDQIDTKDEEFTSFISAPNMTQEDISSSSIIDQKSPIRSSSFKPSSDHIDTKNKEFTSFTQEDINRSSIKDQKSPIRSSSFKLSSDQIDTKNEEFTSFISAANITKLNTQEDMNKSSIEDERRSPNKYKFTDESPDSKKYCPISPMSTPERSSSYKYNLESPVSSKYSTNDGPDNNSTFDRGNLSINLSPEYSQPKFGDISPEASSCLNFTRFETEIPCTSKAIQFSPICAKDSSPDSPPKYVFNFPTLSPPRRAVKSPLSPKETFNPFPVKPTTRQPKELGIKLGMYKDMNPLKSPNK